MPLETIPPMQEHVALAPFTTWQVGGPARYFLEPASVEEVVAAVQWAQAQGLPWVAIGRGSNLLVSDAGFDGLVLRLANRFAAVRFEGDRMVAQAGAPLAQMVVTGLNHGLGGLEPMVGVPGTVGGAVAMNASAHGIAISKGFQSGRVLTETGLETWSHADFDFGYRHSRLHDTRAVFLEGTWELERVEKAQGRARVLELQQWRNRVQPTNVPTGGSTFRNPGEGSPSAGALVEAVGGKGLTVGKAMVSEKHANFIVNCGGATADEINAVVTEVQRRVWEQHGVMLRPEVVGLGITVGLGS